MSDDRRSTDSTCCPVEEIRLSISDTDSEREPELLSDQPSKELLLPGSERSLEKHLYTQQKRRRRIWVSALVLLAVLCISLIGTVLSVWIHRRVAKENRWNVKNFKSIITFGDSYTDEIRFSYFNDHNNTAPPPGTLLGEGVGTNRKWARYVVQYAGSTVDGQWNPRMTLYNYAVAGSFCSGEIVPRVYPTLLEYAIPAFVADRDANRINTSEPYFQPPITASNAVFAVWIGTNDLGMFSFLSDDQVHGKLLADYIECVYTALDGLYAAGARTFVLMNNMPLHLAPSYANESLHGMAIGDDYWIAEKIHELTTSANDIFKYQTPFEFILSNRYQEAQVALFDMWTLGREIYTNPELYYNGTAPANVTSYVTYSEQTRLSPDSFMWWDRIHPSEQTNRIIAKNFIEVLDGTSKYAQYWGPSLTT